MANLKIYEVGPRYQVYRGKGKNANTWYVYDAHESRYVGGNFTTMAGAKAWANAQ